MSSKSSSPFSVRGNTFRIGGTSEEFLIAKTEFKSLFNKEVICLLSIVVFLMSFVEALLSLYSGSIYL